MVIAVWILAILSAVFSAAEAAAASEPTAEQFNLRCVTTATTNPHDPVGRQNEFVIDLQARKWTCRDCADQDARHVKVIKTVDPERIVLIDVDLIDGEGSGAGLAAVIDRKSDVMTVDFAGVRVDMRIKRRTQWHVVRQCTRAAFSGFLETR